MLAVAVLLLVQPVIEGDADCPGRTQLSERLRASGARPDDHLEVDRLAGALRIELRAADGRTIAVRYLESAGTCDELADAVAVLVAAWTAPSPPPPTLAQARTTDAPVAPTPARSTRLEVMAGFLASLAGSDFAPGATAGILIAPTGRNLALRLASAVAVAGRAPSAWGTSNGLG